MFWLYLAILAYFLLAVASVGDRFILIGPLPNPKVFALLIAVLGIFVILIFLPFGFYVPKDFWILVLSLFSGFLWIAALVVYFEAIVRSEVSRVVPAVGAFVPIFTFLATLFLGQGFLSPREVLALFVLIAGGFLITSSKLSIRSLFFRNPALFWIIGAAFLFSVYFISAKIIFSKESFTNAFIWIRLGSLLAVPALLLFSDVRRDLMAQKVNLQRKVLMPVLAFQVAGGSGVIFQNLAVASAILPQLPILNALEGTRYLFLFIFVWLLAKVRPHLLKEEMGGVVFGQKVLSALLIIFGIALLVL